MGVRDIIELPNFRQLRARLAAYQRRVTATLPEHHWKHLSGLKRDAVAAGAQVEAKAVWVLEVIGRVQDHFIAAFRHLSADEFQKAWGRFEQCEIEISFLDRHFIEEGGEFGINHVRDHTQRFQELYPFSWGISPGFLEKQIHCSICDAKLTIRVGCEHMTFEIYDGEMCGTVAKQMELLHVALVDKPAQKYSVISPSGDDDRRFDLIKYVVTALRSPWDGWDYSKEERRQNHPAFKGIKRNDRCPCGSGLKYKRCCLDKVTVMPHFQFSFVKPPLTELPQLTIYPERNFNSPSLF